MSNTQIPTNIPVRLMRIYISRSGNTYFPGVYLPGELPEAAYNSYYVAPEGPAVEPKMLKEASVEVTPSTGKFEVTEIQSTTSPGLVENLHIKTQPQKDIRIKAETYKAQEAPPVKINEALQEELEALKGVGKLTAKKIVELREASAFIDYEDLNARAPLSFGKNWTAFNISFSE